MVRGRARGSAVLRAGAAVGMLVALVAGCTSGGGPTAGTGATAAGTDGVAAPSPAVTTTQPAAEPARLSISPRNGSTGIAVSAPVTVRAVGGRVSTVSLRNGDGEPVAGTYNAVRSTWTSTEPLGYDKTYSLAAVAANEDGKTTRGTSAFSTVVPRTLTLPYLFPGGPDGPSTVGVGQPVQVRFDEDIQDKAAAEKALTVTTTPKVGGAWHWFSDREVHWRPMNYWKPGTKVTVEANVYGVSVGNGIYGQQDVRTSFTIGAAKIFTIDDKTHVGTIKISGKKTRRVPVSMGRGGSYTVDGQTIYFTTQSGAHIVQEKYPVKRMTSASYGLPKDTPLGYDEKISLAVRISSDGEFVHSAPWSVWAQGKQNVSHGCVNISPANAQYFYDNFSRGDIVEIRNTGVDLPFAPTYNEWGVSWAKWTAGSALR
jgi:lipoprotein-anchoring transpeptidase ErfK/SrfK